MSALVDLERKGQFIELLNSLYIVPALPKNDT